jgi:protein arginine kinase activator
MLKICQVCKKHPATVHIKVEKEPGHEQYLCTECAAHAKDTGLTGVLSNLPHYIAEQLSEKITADDPATPPPSGASCPHCRMTWEKFRKGGRLGCANDYTVFAPLLKPIIDDMHSTPGTHIGKQPRRRVAPLGAEKIAAAAATGASTITTADLLPSAKAEPEPAVKTAKTKYRYQQLLKDAVGREDYHEAARLRDLIAALA